MPAQDVYHHTVRQALAKTDWTITHDPYSLPWAKKNLWVDLGAEQLLAAEQAHRKIAVEVKSFLRDSRVADLQQALGQYTLYNDILQQVEPERELYLALPDYAFSDLFSGDGFGQILLTNRRLKLLVFDPKIAEILQWIP
jgi:hypothetical protein